MPMKTIEGYSKEKYTDTSVLLAGGGAKALSSFIGSLTWDSTNKKIQYTPVGGTATDLVTLSWDNISGKPTAFSADYINGVTYDVLVEGDADTYYPVQLPTTTRKSLINTISVWKNLGTQTATYSGNHSNGTSSCWYEFVGRSNSWDGNGGYYYTRRAWYGYARLCSHAEAPGSPCAYLIIWLRGGGTAYKVTVNFSTTDTPIVFYESKTYGSGSSAKTVAPRTDVGNEGKLPFTYIGNVTGSAASATTATSATAADTVKTAARSTDASHYLTFADSNNSTAAAESLYTDAGLVYNPSTNRLIITSSSGQQQEVTVSRTGGSSISMMVGTSNANHGLYSNTASKWIVYSDASGNVTLNGNAATATKLGTANVGAADRPIYLADGVPTQTTYRMAGTNAAATTALAISNNLDTGIWYVNGTNSTDLYSIADGVAYVNKYSDSWIAEIYQDYRTGQIALRGKNNGTWQAWRKVLDSSNFNTWAPKLDGTGATGTWDISISGDADTVDSYHASNLAKQYSYELGPQKCLKITYTSQAPVIISAGRSNAGGQFMLVGLGYGTDGWTRNQFRCLIPSSMFTWKLAGSTTVEIYHTQTSGNAAINVITTGSITFAEASALSGDADVKRFACYDELTWGNISGKPDSFTPTSHTHYIGTTATQNSSAAQDLTGIKDSTFSGVMNITGKADSYTQGIRIHDAAASGTHAISSIWLRAGAATGFTAGMQGITSDSTGMRFRLAASASGTTPTDYLTIAYGGAVTVANKFTASSSVYFTGLSAGSSDVTDATEILTSYAGANGFANTTGAGQVYRRTADHIYNYIKGKTDSLYATSDHTHSTYVLKAGDTMTGRLTFATGQDKGFRFANGTSLDIAATTDDGPVMRGGYFRFTKGTDWDYSSWAGLGYDTTNKIIYLGIPGDGTIFKKNTRVDTGGKLQLVNISTITLDGASGTSYKVWHENNDGSDSGLDADLLDGWNARTIRAYPFNSYTLIDTTPLLQDGLSLDATKCTLVDTVGDGPFRKCWYNNANYTWRSTWVYVHPGDTLTVETWIMKPSDASGTNGTFYIGLECRDVADKVINNNGGTIYVTGLSGISITADSTWKYYRKLFTVPKTHKVYSGSSGKGVYTVRIRAILNYSSGTSPLYWGGVRVFYSDAATYASAIRDKEYHYYDSTTPANGRRASANVNWSDAGLHYFLATSTMSTGKPDNDGHVLHMSWDNGKYEGQLVLPTAESGSLQWRTQGNDDAWKAWKTVLDSDNYTSYTVKKDGTGATGSWGISVTGSAGSVAWGNVTGKPDSFTPASHSHTFAATTSKITNTNEFNFVDAEQTIIWFNYRRASGSSATTATTQFRFSQGTASEAYAKVLADGFIKNGSDSSHVLLGDGGHKPVSDFATSGNYWPLATESYPYLRPGTSNNWIKVGSANDSYGLLPSQAGNAGSGHNYLGTSSWYWKYAYIDNVTVASNLTASGTVVFSGLNQGTSAPTDETEFLTSYASTGGFANTTGAGKVYRRTMSLLWDYISDKIGDNYYKLGRNSNNLNITTTNWNGILPINAFGFRHGRAVWQYSDLDTVTSAAWYNAGSGSGTVTVMTDAEALADNSSYTPSGNSSGKVLKIEPTGSIVSNKIGGTSFRTVTAKDNAVWLQVIRAWLPVGASITASMNGTGTGRTYYWITSKEGTGKWEWYACLHINGHGGTMSTFGHTYATLSGAAIGVKWYIASFQIYELTNNNYDSLRSRYADSASAVPWSGISDIPSTFTPASHNHAAGDITSGTLGVARGGTGKASWTQYGLVYASATTTLAQVSQTWAASKTYWLKAVTNASKVPTYSFVDSLTADKVKLTAESSASSYRYLTFADSDSGEQTLKASYGLGYIPLIGNLQPSYINGFVSTGYGVYLCRYYKSGGSATGSVTSGPSGVGIVSNAASYGSFTGTDSRVEEGKHTITLTNGTKTSWYVWPVMQVHYNITGSQDDCMEFGWANFYDSSSTGVKNVSSGGTVSFTFCCGRIHCQGSWAAKDYVRLTDTPGITITFFGSQAF